MHFSHTNNGGGSKTSRLALVAGLHVALGALIAHGINSKTISLPSLTDTNLVVVEPKPLDPPPPPPDPPKVLQQQLPPPDFVVPRTEVDIAPPPDPVTMQTTSEPAPTPLPFTPSQPPADPAPVTRGNAAAAAVRTAVLADPNACALPDYPARAARNGDEGTTLLALLVGADGRVSSARIEHSSGSKELDRAAMNALSLCRFKPATSNGAPEAGWAQLAYVWKLD